MDTDQSQDGWRPSPPRMVGQPHRASSPSHGHRDGSAVSTTIARILRGRNSMLSGLRNTSSALDAQATVTRGIPVRAESKSESATVTPAGAIIPATAHTMFCRHIRAQIHTETGSPIRSSHSVLDAFMRRHSKEQPNNDSTVCIKTETWAVSFYIEEPLLLSQLSSKAIHRTSYTLTSPVQNIWLLHSESCSLSNHDYNTRHRARQAEKRPAPRFPPCLRGSLPGDEEGIFRFSRLSRSQLEVRWPLPVNPTRS